MSSLNKMESRKPQDCTPLVDLEPWQKISFERGKLKFLRFPIGYLQPTPLQGQRLLLREKISRKILQSATILGIFQESFEESIREGNFEKMEFGEGFRYHSESYISCWNNRFPNSPYDRDLQTLLIEIDGTLLI